MSQAPALPRGFEVPLEPRLPRMGSIDAVALEERAATLAKRSIKRESKLQALELAVRMMDFTTLEGADTPGKVAALCSKALRPDPVDRSVPPVAAVCVYPNLVPTAKQRLAGSTVKVASVATEFPSGQAPTDVKLADVRAAVELGADEIDMVIDRGAFLSGRYAKVYDEIVRVKEASGEAHVKVILETGELGTYDNVRRASLLAMAAGADFIKTSTGKISPAATLPVTLCMLEAIRDVHDETGRMVGMKPAGRDPSGEAGGAVPRRPARDARRRLDDSRPLPLRRVDPAERRADADPQAEDRRLPVPGLLHDRLMSGGRARADRAPPRSSGTTRPRRKRATSCASRIGTASSSAARRSSPGPANGSPPSRPRPRRGSPRSRRLVPKTSRSPSGGARRVRGRMVGAQAGGAGEVSVPDRADPAGALARVRRR